ncbi:MAG: anhydro-N-acetylmuramic acid kinase [Phycisphaerae bacterium]|nr:anhydro-N-acetylmuramic acid kinase [Phycisphaerae bacterium]
MRICGLMSGTSADGVDAAIIDIKKDRIRLLAFDTFAYPAAMRKNILELGEQKLCRAGDVSALNFEIGRVFAEAVIKLCGKSKIKLNTIDLIGSHGQTIYHNPRGKIPSTLQIGEPSIIAHRTGITTAADFRPKDMAAGGQGAPLVPFADYMLFKHNTKNRAVQNIGGIANVTFLPAGGGLQDVIAFDTGPGNMVIDRIVSVISKGKMNYDKGGKIAAGGKINSKLLGEMLRHPYFRKTPPKTTGREMFGGKFCDLFYKKAKSKLMSAQDIVATAAAFTAASIAQAYRKFLPNIPDEIILCGGGAKNKQLIKLLQDDLGETILTTDDFGISSDAKEAVSFAILAYATIKGIKNNVPGATGAEKAEILGKIILV